MHIKSLLDKHFVRCINTPLTSTKSLFSIIAHTLCERYEEINPAHVIHALLAREQLGTTAIGDQVAIPHARLEHLDSPAVLIFKLNTPLTYDADQTQVDLVITLFVPTDEDDTHLSLLSSVSQVFSQTALREKCEQANTDSALFELCEHYANL